MRQNSWFRICLSMLVLLRLALLLGGQFFGGQTSPVFAQAFFPMEQPSQGGRFIEPPRAVMQQLRLAETFAKQRRFSDTSVILGDLLQRERSATDDDLNGQDFFLDASANSASPPRVAKSLMAEARELLGKLPPEGIAAYQLRFGPQARKILDDALADFRWDDVADVKRRFFHTAAGRDATQLLIQRAISSGSLNQANRLIQLLLTHPQLDEKSRVTIQQLSVTLSQMAAAPGEPNAEKTNTTTTGTTTTGTTTTTASDDSAATAWTPRPRRNLPRPDYLRFSGPETTAVGGAGQLPLGDPFFMVVTTGSSRQERALDLLTDSMKSMGELPPPSWLPLRIGNQLVMRSTERLFGIDFTTGKLVWEFPWFQSGESVEPTATAMSDGPDEESGNALLKQRVWNDVPYGRITSDAERIYMLDGLLEVEVAMFSPLMGMQGTRPADNGSNSLLALDLNTEGKLVWQLGGDFAPASELTGAFFLHAPIPIDGQLFVMAELSGDILLICLDAATGIEQWRQQLLAIESGTIGTDPVRRIAGAAATYKDGLLICCTGAGAIVAVDLDDRSLVWGVTINRNEAMMQSVIGRREGIAPDQMLKRWWDATPLVVDSTVYVTPIESDRLYALDLLTGEKKWKETARAQYQSRYLAGMHQGKLILVGGDNVRGVDAATGKSSWTTQTGWLDSSELVCGLGMFGTITHPVSGEPEPVYFVPTSSKRIIAVSVDDGSALAHRNVTFPLGNLIAVDGKIISQSATKLAVAYGEASLQPVVAAALQADPNDLEMIVRKAQLLIEQGERAEALDWLDKARALQGENDDLQDEIHLFSVSAMLGALRDDFSSNADLLAKLEKLIDQPGKRAELLKLQVRAALERNLPTKAIEHLIELSSLVGAESVIDDPLMTTEPEGSRFVELDSWISARINEAVAQADDEQRTAIAQSIESHLARYTTSSIGLLQRLAFQFGSTPGSDPTTQRLLQRLADEQRWLQMERLIYMSSAANPNRRERLKSWQSVSLALAYAQGGMKPDAAAVMAAANAKSSDGVKQAAADLGVDLQQLAVQSAGGGYWKLWEGEVKVNLPDEPIRNRLGSRRIAVADTRRQAGNTFNGWQLISEESSPVGVRDPLGIVHNVPLDGTNRPDETYRQAYFNGGIMIALMPGELVAVNLFELLGGQGDPVLWRRPWRSDSGSSGFKQRSESNGFGDLIKRSVMSSGNGSAVISELSLGPIVGNTLYLLQGNELIALDVTTAQPHWRTMDTPKGGTIICDGNVVAIVSASSQSIVKYDCRDGKRIGEVPFEGFQLWSATDEAVLLYRDLPGGDRELVLRNPINDEVLLEHTFAGPIEAGKLQGRIIDGRYMVTLAASGSVLIWDLVEPRVVSEMTVTAIPGLRSLHVLPRHDSLVLLPRSTQEGEETGNVTMTTGAGLSHVTVDVAAWNIELETGKLAWTCDFGSESWGCTMTQSGYSPLVLFSRSRSRYLPPGSRVKSLDLLAVDTRDGRQYPTLDIQVEQFNNDMETRLTLLAPQQRVVVSIGATVVEYEFVQK